ncbi:MAG: MFS transporter [Rhodospirillaceae bacterium]|nr:MFS transporter [Rhodospirillaceae bacterium]MBT4589458.1 MFS transporter [Rhodospirillaceae bacterium]MBT7267856.1 MFS transporter [Rhodospirillaceae bacterium]
MCLAEVLTLLGVFTFPSLMPEFIETWQLSNTEAGWIAGILLGGYALSVPVLVSLTDRIDARWVYLGGALLTAAALFGFATFASGFWSALLLRMLAGVGLAATFMPGLRVLVDRYGGEKQARALAFYTSSFSLGTAISFYYSGEVGNALGWSEAHMIAGFCAGAAALLVFVTMRPITPAKPDIETKLLDFRPVLRNREAMGYVLAYCAHSWELFAMRSWMVAFLAYSLTLQPGSTAGFMAPTVVVTLSAFFAMVTSIGGSELADRFGRRRMVVIYLISAGLLALVLGFLAALPYWIIVLLVILYAGLVQLDSAALTAGAVMAAEKGRRGATLGLHALIGFGGGAIGPLVVGMVLDLSGAGLNVTSWGLAFASMGIVALLGPLALWKLRGQSST